MRLNLPKHNCAGFEVRADFTVPLEKDAEISKVLTQTLTHQHETEDGDGERTVAIFGSKFTVSDITHRAAGNLSVARRDSEIAIAIRLLNNRAPASLGRPPRDIKPLSLLLTAAKQLFEPKEVNCTATFEYSPENGYTSRVAFPVPLAISENSPGITHIERAEFSSRDDGGLHYRVFVSPDAERDTITHMVRFESTIDWTPGSVRGLLSQARDLSGRLVIRRRGA